MASPGSPCWHEARVVSAKTNSRRLGFNVSSAVAGCFRGVLDFLKTQLYSPAQKVHVIPALPDLDL